MFLRDNETKVIQKEIQDEHKKEIDRFDCTKSCNFKECKGRGICKEFLKANLTFFESIFL